ncbi:MAG: hypothetical protein HQL50_15200, partial [Magnetococcales bacterium]|nr:hypothetical protein [Magnetococcales bacterium]
MEYEAVDGGKKAQKATLGVQGLEHLQSAEELAAEDLLFTVNAQGFKGPALDASHSRPRILAIGDSCTFGSLLDRSSYPRVMERAFLEQHQLRVEVVNGGVEGYAPRHSLTQLHRYVALEPEWTLIYLGWNALFRPEEQLGPMRQLAMLRFLQKVRDNLARMIYGRHKLAMESMSRPKQSEPDSVEVRRYANHFTPTFADDFEELASAMQTAGSRVVVLTLPGLYASDVPMTERA